MQKFKVFIPVALAFFISIFFNVDFSTILENSTKVSFLYAATLILVIYTLNFFVSSLRLKILISQLTGININYKDSCHTILMGQLGGTLPVFGSFLGQSVALNKSNNLSYTTGGFIAFYDKISMAAVGGILAICSGIIISDISFWSYISSQFSFLWLLFIFSISVFFSLCFGINKKDIYTLKSFVTLNNLKKALFVALVGSMTWFLSASAFGVAAFIMYNDGSLSQYVMGGLIISVIASLPLSVNGWGIREFAAITIFGFLGLPQDIALLTSISVGLFSYLSLFISMFVMSIQKRYRKNSSIIKKVKAKACNFEYTLIEQRIIYFLGCATSVSLFFQIYFSWQSITININLGDIIACIGFLIMIMGYKNRVTWFAIPKTGLYILGIISAFSLSLIYGFLTYGYTHFAMINKFMGFFILLGYGALGAIFFYHNGISGYRTLVRIMSITLLTILLSSIILNNLVYCGIISIDHLPPNLNGFAANRNAFALQLLMVLALQISYLNNSRGWLHNVNLWIISVFIIGIYLTFSRSGLITIITLLLFLLALGLVRKRNIMQIILLSCSIVAFFFVMDAAILADFDGGPNEAHSMFTMNYSGDSSDHERFYTILEGLRLFIDNPILGGGLGRFMFDEVLNHNRPLVIHNTFVWLLAEFGLIGIMPFVLYGFHIVQSLYIRWRNSAALPLNEREKALISFLLIFAAMGMVHEIFYQRCLWFIGGLLLAKTIDVDKRKKL